MGTSLTPEFWEHFSVFLVLALAITAILSAVFTTVFDALNSINRNETFTPKWSDLPLQKSWQKVKPPLGWPRETMSPSS